MSKKSGLGKKIRTITIRLDDIKTTFFVRKRLNDNHVLALAELKESGVDLDNIDVDENLNNIDGRHRVACYDLLGIEEIEVDVWRYPSEEVKVAAAYMSNSGGALPPTQEDTEYTIKAMLDANVSQKRIIELLGLNSKLLRGYVERIRRKEKARALQNAKDAVASGELTVVKAAEAFDVQLPTLKAAISGKKVKETSRAGEIGARLVKLQKQRNNGVGQSMRVLQQELEDGDTSKGDVLKSVRELKRLLKAAVKRTEDWETRIKAMD